MSSNEVEQVPVECRICHSRTTRDLILSPCLCKGSLAYVHYRCLEKWLNYASRDSCELCSHKFDVVLNRRYSCMQSVRVWLRHPTNRAFMLCDLAIGLVLTSLTLALALVCFLGLSHFVKEGYDQGIQNFWSEGIVDFFLLILLAGYLATMYSMARDHIRPWYRWWTRCYNVRLVPDKLALVAPESSESSLAGKQTRLKVVAEKAITIDETCCHMLEKVELQKVEGDCSKNTCVEETGSGSMGCVHVQCLEQWLNFSSHSFCELCSYRFEVIQVRRYSLLKSIGVWICQDQGSLYKAMFFVFLSATNSILLCWMWFLWLTNTPNSFNKTDKDHPNPKNQDLTKPKWMAVFVFLTLLTVFSVKSLCVDGYRAIKNQYHAWYRWWNDTVNVQLVMDLENYKIKNRFEELPDIGYAKEKDGIQNSTGKTLELPDVDQGPLKKMSFEAPDTRSLIKHQKDVEPEAVMPTVNAEEKTSNVVLNVLNHEPACKKQEVVNEADEPNSVEILYEYESPVQFSDDFPKVHKHIKTDQD